MKTFKISNFSVIIKFNNNKIIVELIDLISNNIFKKEFTQEQIILEIVNPLYIKEINSLNINTLENLNINEIYNLCNDDDKSENFKEYELVEDLNGYFLGNIENKHNKLSIIKNENSIKLLFNCEINTIIQLNIIFNFNDIEYINFNGKNITEDKINITEDKINITEDKINITEDKINITEDKINITEDKINIIEDKINIIEDKINIIEDKINIIEDKIKKYDNRLIPDITINNIIFTLIIVGCINNIIKNFYKK